MMARTHAEMLTLLHQYLAKGEGALPGDVHVAVVLYDGGVNFAYGGPASTLAARDLFAEAVRQIDSGQVACQSKSADA